MDTKALRQKILDLAIRGKLVPQNPEDEPASVLLERIRREKQQMVKDGKLKAKDIKNDSVIFVGEDSLHYEKFQDGSVKCIEDEIPFEVPEGWAWERLGNVSTIARGGSPRPIDDYITEKHDGINWIKIGDTEKDGKYIYTTKEKIKSEGIAKSRYVKSGDFLLTNSMSFGRPYILKTDGCIHDGWLVIGNIKFVFNENYLYYALSSTFMYQNLSLLAAGSTVKNLKSDSVKLVLFPIPPMNEQREIAKKLDQFIDSIASISRNKAELVKAANSVKLKILDLAIRGKLVPQDQDDEPASVLLKHIRKEKEKLIKAGKIKRDKNESIIFRGADSSYYEKFADGTIKNIDEEIPFEIPSTWEWIRLQSCCSKEIKRGKSPKYAKKSNTLVFAQKCNTKYNGIDIKTALYLDESMLNKYMADEYMRHGDIVINSTGTGTLGRVGYYQVNDNLESIPIVPDSHVTVIRAYDNIRTFYLYLFMKANQSALEKKGEGSTNQKELKPATLKAQLVPIPPYEEQTRIIKSINSIFTRITALEKNLS